MIKQLFIYMMIACVAFLLGRNDASAQVRRKGLNFFRSAETEINLHFTPTNTSLRSSTYASEETDKSGYTVGGDYGYFFMNYSKLVIGAGIGINLSTYNAQRKTDFNNTVQINDPDNDIVIIKEFGTINETEKVSFVEFPIVGKAYINLWKKTSFFLNLGPNFLIPIVKTYKSSGPYTRTGYLPKYNSPLSDINIPGTQYYYPTNAQLSTSGNMKLGFGIGIIGNAGFKHLIMGRYSAFGGFSFLYGVKNINRSNSDSYQLSSGYNSLNSLLVRGDKINNIAYGFQFGVSIMLGKIQAPKKPGGSKTGGTVGKK